MLSSLVLWSSLFLGINSQRVALVAFLETFGFDGYGRVDISQNNFIVNLKINASNFPASLVITPRILAGSDLLASSNELLLGSDSDFSSCSTRLSTKQATWSTLTVSQQGSISETISWNFGDLYSGVDLSSVNRTDFIVGSLAGRTLVFRSTGCDDGKPPKIYAKARIAVADGSGSVPIFSDAASIVSKDDFAVATLFPTFTNKSSHKTSGFITFAKTANGITVTPYLTGCIPGIHAIHVHANGQLSDALALDTKGHYNPLNRYHGCPNTFNNTVGHAGDLGNFAFDANGTINILSKDTYSVTTNLMSLTFGDNKNVVGRAVVVHLLADSCETSNAITFTGNAGSRLAYGVIERIDTLDLSAIRDKIISKRDANGYFLDYLNHAKAIQGILPSPSPSPSGGTKSFVSWTMLVVLIALALF